MMYKVQADAALDLIHLKSMFMVDFIKVQSLWTVRAGASTGLFVWKDRLGINLRTQLDQDHLTLTGI